MRNYHDMGGQDAGPIERFRGHVKNSGELAYTGPGTPLRALYRVRCVQSQVGPSYAGAAADTLDIDLFEHRIERTEEQPR